jgi:hypothetical protein
MKKLLLMILTLALAMPVAIAGEKTVTISRNEGIYDDGTGVYYCTKDGVTMTFSSGLNNVNYLVEHQQVVFDIFSTNYVIKKIKFNCLDNTTDDNLDCFYWGPSTISEFTGAPYTPTGTYTYSGYIGTWVGGSTPSSYVKFVTEAKPVRFGSVEITYDKEFGDIYDLVTQSSEIQNGQTYALVSQRDSRALGKEEYHGSDPYTTYSSTPVTLLNNNQKVKVTDEVQLIKLQSTGNSSRPWYLKVGDNYMRRRSGTMSGSGTNQGYNLYSVGNIPSGSEDYFRVSISFGNNSNALIRFYHNSSETQAPSGGVTKTFAIRHYNGGDLFRVMDYSSNNSDATYQRVYLYKPAESFEVITECDPVDGGYISLGSGILTDYQGKNWSQHYDNVTFFVGPTEGYGVNEVTVTNLSTNEVTVLQPTSTSDFGNDYSFEMPGANVKVTATFVEPHVIHTVSNPADGGSFSFINGYTDFNGETMSNEGKTVTFKPEPADGYIFNSVTYTDDVTGVTTTLTPDADGVFSFVMPGNDVTLTANFEEAHDLYLLGTANGETGWHPYGPKFTFDGATATYYLDVYFKGGNDDPYADPAYGYFSLTKRISENWSDLNGYRLAAEYNNYWVEDGSTGVVLYGDRPDNAFKIKPGVYRITVNYDMTQMSITEYPLTLTFDPVSGSVVDPGQVVTISSNIDELVHNINPNEIDAVFYNTTNNWATQENDNTAVITQDGITTVTANANLGYIHVEGQANYEIIGDLYLLGTANGETGWHPYGPKFTYDADNEEYYIDVYFKGGNDDPNADPAYGYFSLTKKISENWGDLVGYRLAAEYNNYWVENGSADVVLYGDRPDNAFKIKPGVYRITVNKAKNRLSVTEYPLSLTFNPESGSIVDPGQVVTISSNLDDLVHGINANEVDAAFKNSLDGGTNWDNDNTAVITETGATTTVTAEASIGYIVVPGTAVYTTPEPTPYAITTLVDPEDAGQITAPSGALAGETVNFSVEVNSPYVLYNVEVAINGNNQIVEPLNDNGDGTYSFTMPDGDVTIYADFATPLYMIERDGEVEKTYTIADQLLGVFAFGNSLWCKDLGNISIVKTEPNDENQVDMMMTIEEIARPGGWDQSNWVELILDNINQATAGVNQLIKPCSVTGEFTDKLNYKIRVDNAPLQFDGELNYDPNTYCTVNFLENNLTLEPGAPGAISLYNGNSYYFLNPKIQEYAAVTFAMWDRDQQMFVIPMREGTQVNGHDFDGAIRLDSNNGWYYNMYGDVTTELNMPENANNVYTFHILVQRDNDSYGASAEDGPNQIGGPSREQIKPNQTASATIKAYPLDLRVDSEHIITAVNEVNLPLKVASVEYINVIGVKSDTPFDGVNIVVTRYSDGSIRTTKILK